MKFLHTKEPNGHLAIRYRGLYLVFEGGPYVHRPLDRFGVCLLPKVPAGVGASVHVPAEDFTPPPKEELEWAVEKAIRAAIKGQVVYIGCTAGVGRTGTALAATAKALGIENPVFYVRAHYMSSAVETKAQENLIQELDFEGLSGRLIVPIWRRKIALWFQGWRK